MSVQSPCRIEFLPTGTPTPIVLVPAGAWMGQLPRFEVSQDLYEPAGIYMAEGFFSPLGAPGVSITFAVDDDHDDLAAALGAFLGADVAGSTNLLRISGALRIAGPNRIDVYTPAILGPITPGLPFGPVATVSRAFVVTAAMPSAPILLPANTALPSITIDTMDVGGTATASPGTWTGGPGLTYSYQWYRNGAMIPGATSAAYTLAEADDGTELTVRVGATNVVGTAFATSEPVAITFPIDPPVNLEPPVIIFETGVFFAHPGEWQSGDSVSGRWQLEQPAGTWTDIPGAGSLDYTYDSGLGGLAVRYVETAVNSGGSTQAPSNSLPVPTGGDSFGRPGGGRFKRPGGGDFLRP